MMPFWVVTDAINLPVHGRLARNSWRGCTILAEDLFAARELANEMFGLAVIEVLRLARPAFPVMSSDGTWLEGAEVCKADAAIECVSKKINKATTQEPRCKTGRCPRWP